MDRYPKDVDERYAALVETAGSDFAAALERVKPRLSAEQLAVAEEAWVGIAKPNLIQHLDALVGPARPVIAEACIAYNKIGEQHREEENFNGCQGETVAVVTRLGRPESPGVIISHWPGCMKHAQWAVANLGATELSKYQGGGESARIFHSIVDLEDARREIRQQELRVATARKRRWWPF